MKTKQNQENRKKTITILPKACFLNNADPKMLFMLSKLFNV